MSLWNQTSQPKIPKVHQYQWKLDESAVVQLDANGSGQTQLAPGGAREKWTINFVAVNCSQLPDSSFVPTLIMYRASAVNGNQLGGTFAATMDADSSSVYNLNMNEPVVFVFTGGDPFAIANIHIEGIRYVWE